VQAAYKYFLKCYLQEKWKINEEKLKLIKNKYFEKHFLFFGLFFSFFKKLL